MKKYARISACFLAFATLVPAHAAENPSTETSQTPTQVATPQSIAFQTLEIGAQSGLVRPAKMLISSEAEWQRVWQLHSQVQKYKTSAPPIDFAAQSVVALMSGQSFGGASIQIVRIAPDKNTTIYFAQTRGWKEEKTASQPFHFAVVPKIEGAPRFIDANQDCSVCVVR